MSISYICAFYRCVRRRHQFQTDQSRCSSWGHDSGKIVGIREKKKDVFNSQRNPLLEFNVMLHRFSFQRYAQGEGTRNGENGREHRKRDKLSTLMSSRIFQYFLALTFLSATCWSNLAIASSYQYLRIDAKTDSTATPSSGTAMMGGGKDLDDAFRWLCTKGNGGDFLILRAIGDDAYNSYVNGICKMNSVATLVIPDINAANDPAVVDIIRHAEAVFIAGGNQARYVNFWRGTAVQDALNRNISEGRPIGEPAQDSPFWVNSVMDA